MGVTAKANKANVSFMESSGIECLHGIEPHSEGKSCTLAAKGGELASMEVRSGMECAQPPNFMVSNQ